MERDNRVLELNLWFGWLWIMVGLLSGTMMGLFFYDSNWLGGYSSWRRRMVRLGHISFLGTGLLNLAAAFTGAAQPDKLWPAWLSALFVLGALTMPTVCFLSAWRDGWRQLFFIPVASLLLAVLGMIVQGVR
jgi:hypothetical protein